MARTVSSTIGYLSTGALASPPIVTACSLSCWFYSSVHPTSATYTILGCGSSSVSNAYLGLAGFVAAGNTTFGVFSSGGSQLNTQSSLVASAGNWYHLCGTWGGGNQTIYVNGGNSNVSAYAVPSTNMNQDSIGCLILSGSIFSRPNQTILVGEAATWTATLTANEALALSKGMRPFRVRPLSLYAYWPLYGLQNTEPDLSGRGQFMALTGSPALGVTGPPMEPFSSRGTVPMVDAAAVVPFPALPRGDIDPNWPSFFDPCHQLGA